MDTIFCIFFSLHVNDLKSKTGDHALVNTNHMLFNKCNLAYIAIMSTGTPYVEMKSRDNYETVRATDIAIRSCFKIDFSIGFSSCERCFTI